MPPKGCHKSSIKKELAEELVLKKVMNEMFTEDMIEDIADSVMMLQKRENTAVPLLKEQLAEVEKGIENMLNAMQAGVLTKSTKKRLDDLEAQKEKLEIDIMREELQQEVLTRDMVVIWLRKMKQLDLTNDDNKRILIDTFVNSVQVFDDKLIVSFNNREGASEIALLTDGCSAGRGLGELQKARKHNVYGLFLCLKVGGDLTCRPVILYIKSCSVCAEFTVRMPANHSAVYRMIQNKIFTLFELLMYLSSLLFCLRFHSASTRSVSLSSNPSCL